MNSVAAGMDDGKQRGAAPVNDELEVGYDERFETRWRRIELASHAGMLLIVLAALAGLFGRGPLSHHTQQTADGRFSVDFEPLCRFGTSTQITIHLPPSGGTGSAPVRLFLGSATVEPLGLQMIVPQPDRTELADGGQVYVFRDDSSAGGAIVRLIAKPNAVGPQRIEARAGGEALFWTQWVLP